MGKLFTLSALQVPTSSSLTIKFRNLNLINVCSPLRPRRGYCRPAAVLGRPLLSDSDLSRIRPPGSLTVSTTCVQIARIRFCPHAINKSSTPTRPPHLIHLNRVPCNKRSGVGPKCDRPPAASRATPSLTSQPTASGSTEPSTNSNRCRKK